MSITAAEMRQAMVDKQEIVALTPAEIDRMIAEIDVLLNNVCKCTQCQAACVGYKLRGFQRDDPNKGKLWHATDCSVAAVKQSLETRGFTVQQTPVPANVSFQGIEEMKSEYYYITWPQ